MITCGLQALAMSRPPASFADQRLPFLMDEVALAALPTGRLPSYISDHRKRLRARFMSGGAQAPPDYELLELVLFRAVPRQDVKPLAHLLLSEFGDFNRVLTAPPARLRTIKGVGDAVITDSRSWRHQPTAWPAAG
jgi:DNA repair protein RadC